MDDTRHELISSSPPLSNYSFFLSSCFQIIETIFPFQSKQSLIRADYSNGGKRKKNCFESKPRRNFSRWLTDKSRDQDSKVHKERHVYSLIIRSFQMFKFSSNINFHSRYVVLPVRNLSSHVDIRREKVSFGDLLTFGWSSESGEALLDRS